MANTSFIKAQEAIIQKLESDITISNLANGIFSYVPNTREFPFITVGTGEETPFNSFGRKGKDLSLNIGIWDTYKGFKRTYQILEKLIENLNHQQLAIDEFQTVLIRYIDSNPNKEVVNDIRMIEATFRIVVQDE